VSDSVLSNISCPLGRARTLQYLQARSYNDPGWGTSNCNPLGPQSRNDEDDCSLSQPASRLVKKKES
jgi:hypothetical protein